MKIPGPDGKFGFGGHCLPKDANAMISFGESLGLNMHTLKGVRNTNLEVRPERDWEDDPRAFTQESELPFKNGIPGGVVTKKHKLEFVFGADSIIEDNVETIQGWSNIKKDNK